MVHPLGEAVVVGKRIVAYRHQVEDHARLVAFVSLRTVAAHLQEEGMRVTMEVRCGDAVAMALEVAEDVGADLITLAIRAAKGRRRLWAKTTTERLLQRALVPVLVARSRNRQAA
jgi:nucleotide-binding universal stress UspA family protein